MTVKYDNNLITKVWNQQTNKLTYCLTNSRIHHQDNPGWLQEKENNGIWLSNVTKAS